MGRWENLIFVSNRYVSLEKFEDTKRVIRSHRAKKDRQYNGQKKKDTEINNCRQSKTKKAKDWATRTRLQNRVELKASNCSCSTIRTHFLKHRLSIKSHGAICVFLYYLNWLHFTPNNLAADWSRMSEDSWQFGCLLLCHLIQKHFQSTSNPYPFHQMFQVLFLSIMVCCFISSWITFTGITVVIHMLISSMGDMETCAWFHFIS